MVLNSAFYFNIVSDPLTWCILIRIGIVTEFKDTDFDVTEQITFSSKDKFIYGSNYEGILRIVVSRQWSVNSA